MPTYLSKDPPITHIYEANGKAVCASQCKIHKQKTAVLDGSVSGTKISHSLHQRQKELLFSTNVILSLCKHHKELTVMVLNAFFTDVLL